MVVYSRGGHYFLLLGGWIVAGQGGGWLHCQKDITYYCIKIRCSLLCNYLYSVLCIIHR